MVGLAAYLVGARKNVVLSEDNMAKISIALNAICLAWIATIYNLDFDNKEDKEGQEINHE